MFEITIIGALALCFLFFMGFNSASYLAGNAPDRTNGQVQVVWGKYNFDDDGAVALAEVCNMFTLPKNARVLDMILSATAMPAGTTISVGDADSSTGWMATITCSNAVHLSLCGGVSNNAEIDKGPGSYQIGKTYTDSDAAERTIKMVFGTDIPVTGDEVYLACLYTIEGGFDDET